MFAHDNGLIQLAHKFALELWFSAFPVTGLPDCGSGFLYTFGGKTWLVTAAHNVENLAHGEQTLITGKVASPIVTIIQPSPSGNGRGGGGVNVLDGRTALYFRLHGKLVDLFAAELQPHEVPTNIIALHSGVIDVTGEEIMAAVATIASAAGGTLNGMNLTITDRLIILGFASGVFGGEVPPKVSPAIAAVELPNPIGSHGFTMALSGQPGVSGGPVLRALPGNQIQLAGIYTHSIELKSLFGPIIPGSFATSSKYIFSACTPGKPGGLQIVDF
jgi:hypothetical protein